MARKQATRQSRTSNTNRSDLAPGQAFGYSLQFTRAVIRLLQSDPGSFVSVEVLDDVAVQSASGTAIAEQVKSGVHQNPVSDRAIELWKTFANWIDAVEDGHVPVAATRFQLYVSSGRTGRIVESFSKAATHAEATSALRAGRRILWGPEPAFPDRPSVAATLKPYVERVLAAPEPLVAEIIARFELLPGDDALAEIESLVSRNWVSPEAVPHVVRQALGWVKQQIDASLGHGRAAILSRDTFHLDLTAFVRDFDRKVILAVSVPEPDEAAIAAELSRKMYIRQLDLIECEEEVKLQAANDYLRASIQRTEWASRGLVHTSSLDAFEDELVRFWKARRMAARTAFSGRPEVDEGQWTYAECSACRIDLSGNSVPGFFRSGCYHALADDSTVGWHPRYRDELKPKRRPTARERDGT